MKLPIKQDWVTGNSKPADWTMTQLNIDDDFVDDIGLSDDPLVNAGEQLAEQIK
jgi:hypothetical protein